MKYYILSFLGGALIGVAGSWYFAKKHYEDIANAEMHERLAKRKPKKSPDEKSEKPKEKTKTNPASNTWNGDKGELSEYVNHIKKYDTRDIDTLPNRKKNPPEEEEKETVIDDIEMIPESLFGDNDDYDQITLTYYANDILADDVDEIIDDRESVVGNVDFVNDFDKDDAIYICNHRHKAYYEVLRSEEDYSDNRPIRV